MFKYVDLFAGIGGFRLALAASGGECVYSSEINPACREVYRNNFGDEPTGDIKRIDECSVPDHDILAGGFPCQAFSIAGNKRGFEDTRGTLFFEVLYRPWPTVLLSRWRENGGETMDGIDLLVHQAIEQIALFSGKSVDRASMAMELRKVAIASLE